MTSSALHSYFVTYKQSSGKKGRGKCGGCDGCQRTSDCGECYACLHNAAAQPPARRKVIFSAKFYFCCMAGITNRGQGREVTFILCWLLNL